MVGVQFRCGNSIPKSWKNRILQGKHVEQKGLGEGTCWIAQTLSCCFDCWKDFHWCPPHMSLHQFWRWRAITVDQLLLLAGTVDGWNPAPLLSRYLHSFTRFICPGGAGLQILQPSTRMTLQRNDSRVPWCCFPKMIFSEISKLAQKGRRWWFDDVFFLPPRQQWLSCHESWWNIKHINAVHVSLYINYFIYIHIPAGSFPRVLLSIYKLTVGRHPAVKPCQLKTAWCLPWETIGWTDFHPGDPSLWTVQMVCEVNSRLHSEQGAGKQTFRELTLEVIRKELFEKQMLLQLSFPETHVCSRDARCVRRNVLC